MCVKPILNVQEVRRRKEENNKLRKKSTHKRIDVAFEDILNNTIKEHEKNKPAEKTFGRLL